MNSCLILIKILVHLLKLEEPKALCIQDICELWTFLFHLLGCHSMKGWILSSLVQEILDTKCHISLSNDAPDSDTPIPHCLSSFGACWV